MITTEGVNKIILIGHLGNEPETRRMPNGTAVTTLRLATTDRPRGNEKAGKEPHTEWHRIVFIGELGEIAGETLVKGSHVYVEGALRTRQWQKFGQTHYQTEVIGRELLIVGI
jgi:single-strand DNA-binding protein